MRNLILTFACNTLRNDVRLTNLTDSCKSLLQGITMVKSNKEYVAEHRARKSALAFSTEYMEGKLVCTPEVFIEAKGCEVGEQQNVNVLEFNLSLINPFYEYLKDEDEQDGEYTVDGLMTAWKRAVKEAS